MSTKNLGNELRRLRKQAGLGLKGAAPRLGISYTYLSKLENGLKNPSSGLLIRFCELYGTDEDKLTALAGDLPVDVREILLKHGDEAFELLRTTYRK